MAASLKLPQQRQCARRRARARVGGAQRNNIAQLEGLFYLFFVYSQKFGFFVDAQEVHGGMGGKTLLSPERRGLWAFLENRRERASLDIGKEVGPLTSLREGWTVHTSRRRDGVRLSWRRDDARTSEEEQRPPTPGKE